MLRRKYRWIKIYKYYLNVMVASFWGGGKGGGGGEGRGGGGPMHGRARGIALLCVQMINRHTFRREKNCYATEPSC